MWKFILSLLCVAFLSGMVPQAQAQQSTGTSSQSLPPALRAAVSSGNSDAIQRAIATLSGGNPQQASSLAVLVAAQAERMVALNPAAAAAAASAAVQVISTPSVMNASPQQALSVVVMSSRLAINPSVQAASPSVVGRLSARLTQVATSQQVYSVSPDAALQVMSNAYSAASASGVNAASPGGLASITRMLVVASENPALAQILTTTGMVITAIISKQSTPDGIREIIQEFGSAS